MFPGISWFWKQLVRTALAHIYYTQAPTSSYLPCAQSESSMVEEEEKEGEEILARDDDSPLSIRQRDSGFSESILGT